MKTKFLVFLSCVSCFSWFPTCSFSFAADPLTEALQQGLLEEEVNRNLPAAVQAYETAVKQADAQRQAAATAVFRLAETYRKLGRTNEAVAHYRRILDQFADQPLLVGLSRTNLARLAPEPSAPSARALTPGAQRQRELLQQELALVEEQLDRKQQQVESGVASRDDLIALQREALALQRQIVEVESRVRPDLLDITLPPPAPAESAVTASLRDEIKLLETQVADLEARSADRTSTGEVDKARRELLRLEAQLPENADPARQKALLDEAMALARRQVTNTALLVEAGRAPKADEVQAQRELLALERDLARLTSFEAAGASAAPRVAPSSADPADVASLREEIAMVEQELETNRRKLENGKAEATEVRRSQKELLRLQRQLPENASRERQTALLQDELKLAEENLGEVGRRIEVGTAAPLDEIPFKRERLALQRELRALERAASAPAPIIPTVSLNAPSGSSEVALPTDEPPLTLAQLVVKYAGDDSTADRTQVRLIRLNPSTGQTETRHVNVEEVLRGGGSGDVVLQAGDAVEVPSRSATARSRAATREEAAEIERIEAIIKDSPDLVNARNATPGGGTPLHKAAANGYVAVAEFLLANHADVTARADNGDTALHEAAAAGHKRLCELLLAKGAEVNAANQNAYTPLHRAVRGGYAGVAETLLAAGADVNAKGFVPPPDRQPREDGPNWSEMETTPLHSAAEKGFPVLVELLAKHGADLNARDRGGRTPLIRGVLANQPATVRLLLEKGADVNAEDGEERTALAHAVANQNLPMVQLLLEHKADTEGRVSSGNSDFGWTVLFEPVGKGKVDVARLLLDRGANVNAEGTTGITPVHWAVIQNASATLKLLLERKANVNTRDTGGNTPLQYALEFPILPNVEALLGAGADANARGWSGGEERDWPPLLRVIGPDPERAPATVVNALLKHGADVNAGLTNGWTALHAAAEADRADLAELLVNQGADVQARGAMPKAGPALGERRAKGTLVVGVTSAPRRAGRQVVGGQGMMAVAPAQPAYTRDLLLGTLYPNAEVTPLHLAVANQNLALARFLLEHGADVNARDAKGRTPLHYAVNRRDLGLIRAVLDAKADPNASDAEGQTPLAILSKLRAREIGGGEIAVYGNTSSDRGYISAEMPLVIAALLRERGATEPGESTPKPDGVAAGVAPTVLPKVGVARVLGEVKRPGTVSLGLGPRKDIIDAIAECGGFTENARPQIEFTRGGVTRQFTLDELKAEADPAKKLWLEPGDTIEVKPKMF